MTRSLLLTAALAAAAGLAHASPVSPTYSTFGNLAGATFGGTGIPTDPTAITTAGNVTIGLTAHQRYLNPALTNDGAGTFTATTGVNDGLVGSPNLGALWNFAFYVNVGDLTLSSYQIDLFYDLDAGAGTDLSAMGRVDLDTIAFATGNGANSILQDSSNLYFGSFASGIPGFVFAPGGSFNPNATGEYSFLLRVSDGLGTVVAESAINVNVVGPQAVPEPGSLALAGLALAGLAAAGRRRA